MNTETQAAETVAPTEPVTETPATSGAASTETVNAEAEQTESGEKQGQQRKPIAPRIAELTRAQREAERERDYWRQSAETREASEAAAAKAAADKKPVP